MFAKDYFAIYKALAIYNQACSIESKIPLASKPQSMSIC